MRSKNFTDWQPELSGWIKPKESRRRLPLAFLACALLLLLLPSVTFAEEPQKNVLLFYSDDLSLPANMLITQAIRSTLKERWKSPLQIYDEGQDSFRIPGEKYDAELLSLLQKKYEGVHFDLIFALGPPALSFLLKHQTEVFNDTPIVYLVTDPSRITDLSLGPNVTGVSTKVELAPTLELALKLQPQTQNVVVISGNAPINKGLLGLAQREFRNYEGKVAFTYLIDLTPEEMRQRLAALPANSIVIYLGFSADRNGRAYNSADVVSLLASSSKAPIYGPTQPLLGYGIVGGDLLSFEALGLSAAQIGLRVLARESPSTIASQTLPSVPMFDWRELRRWDIDENKLPAGSIVLFREFSVWELYKWRIIGVIALILLQTLLIGRLLVTQTKRRQAETDNERLARIAEAERRHRDEVVSNVPGIVWEVRSEPGTNKRKVVFVSDYAEKMSGYSVAEWLATPGFALTIIPDAERAQSEREVQALFESGKAGVFQFRWRTKDGRNIWVESQVAPVFDEAGKSIGMRGVTMDITDRKHAEEALTESEDRYRNVVETQTELICRYLPDSTLTFVNDAYCRYFARTREDLIGTKFVDLIPSHAQAAALNHVTSLVERPRAEIHEHEVLLADGRTGWQQWINHVVPSSNGHAIELQGIGSDITEKRKAEEELRLSEARFRTMADSAPLMIWMSGTDLKCNYVNQGWLEFTGRTIEQELGDGWTAGIYEGDYESSWKSYTAAFERHEPFTFEYRLRRADGIYRWIYSAGTPRFNLAGEFIGYIGTSIDISDRKEAEEKLNSALEEVSKLKNQLEAENIYLQEEIKLTHNVNEIIGHSNAIKYVLFKVEQVTRTDSTVLILGETGTGKELVARAIHNQSLRRDRPLVKVNCAALSPSLIESELFGHEKGAFTGALARRIGRFELADGATIFLDEIGELPLELQSKLLRVVQEGEFERLGSTKTIKVDVRILAATNRNLKSEVERGAFREDLWYRLNVFPITVPPLRQRKEDIPPMVEHFVSSLSRKKGKEITSISSITLKKLQDYSWPGNVRELANVVERAVVNARGPVLHIADKFEEGPVEAPSSSNKTLEAIEKEYILRILEDTGWRIEGPNGAARVLGLNASTLRTRMAKLRIQKSMRASNGANGSE